MTCTSPCQIFQLLNATICEQTLSLPGDPFPTYPDALYEDRFGGAPGGRSLAVCLAYETKARGSATGRRCRDGRDLSALLRGIGHRIEVTGLRCGDRGTALPYS